MRNGLLIVLLIFFTVGCKNKNGVPGSVLPPEKMQVILWDMMRADQFLTDYVLNKDSSLNKTTESLKYYQQIFAIHKISKEEFQHSFFYYKSHPILLKAIMDSISTPLKVPPAQSTKPDSASVSPVQDTTKPGPDKTIQDTSILKKGKRKLTVN